MNQKGQPLYSGSHRAEFESTSKQIVSRVISNKRPKHRSIAYVSHFAGWLVFAFALQVLGVPLLAALPIAAVLSRVLVQRHGMAGHLAIATSVVLAISFFEFGARSINSDRTPSRPHEIMSAGDQPYYRVNQRVDDFEVPHGDLFALSDRSEPTMIEPRKVRFQTDALGFRNANDYGGQAFVLLGDSFGVGISSSQEDTLSELLTRDHELPTYDLSWPTDTPDHIERLLEFRHAFVSDFEALVMIFEGNDFGVCRSEKGFKQRWFGLVLKPIRKLESHQVFSRLVTKTSGWLGLSKRGKVSLWRIGERDVGFYDRYIAVTRRASLAGCKLDEEFSTLAKIQRDIGLLIFVPTKYRVYHSLLPNAEQTSLPNLQLQYLAAIAKELEVPFLDLTPALEEHSRSLLAQDRYTFWRDDTHWSPTGMKLAAREIANALRARRRIRESGPAGLQ